MLRLIIVIIITAIVSVSGYLKMLNIQSDARHATLQSIVGTIHSMSDITYTKSLLRGIDSSCPFEDDDTNNKGTAFSNNTRDHNLFIEDIYTCYGYPTGHIDNVKKAFGLDDSLYVTNTVNASGGLTASISFKLGGKLNYHCRVIYSDAKTTANSTRAYQVEFIDSDC